MPLVLLLATLETKREEVAFLEAALTARDLACEIVDLSLGAHGEVWDGAHKIRAIEETSARLGAELSTRLDGVGAVVGLGGGTGGEIILRVMHALEMISQKGVARARAEPMHASSTSWTRAPAGGLVRLFKGTGEYVSVDDLLGVISDPFGEEELEVRSATAGVVIGRTNLPVVNEGDALYHVAEIADPEPETTIGHLTRQLGADPMFDEDEII